MYRVLNVKQKGLDFTSRQLRVFVQGCDTCVIYRLDTGKGIWGMGAVFHSCLVSCCQRVMHDQQHWHQLGLVRKADNPISQI